jgi:hypothetical protein
VFGADFVKFISIIPSRYTLQFEVSQRIPIAFVVEEIVSPRFGGS